MELITKTPTLCTFSLSVHFHGNPDFSLTTKLLCFSPKTNIIPKTVEHVLDYFSII